MTGQVLTSSTKSKADGIQLEGRRAFFRIVIAHELEKKYCFKKLEKRNVKDFERFIEKTVGERKTITQVDQEFKCRSDSSDFVKVDGQRIPMVHYRVTDSCRVHGYYLGPDFVLLRIDPNHSFHN